MRFESRRRLKGQKRKSEKIPRSFEKYSGSVQGARVYDRLDVVVMQVFRNENSLRSSLGKQMYYYE